MKDIKFSTLVKYSMLAIAILFVSRGFIEKGLDRVMVFDTGNYAIDFIDDSGKRIVMTKPATRIISLYSAHTENLYSLGVERSIVGVGTSDVYPASVLEKTVYDYKSDPEKVISARPDLVLIRPFIARNYPDFVKTMERTGINVVSLYPEKFDQFSDYILKLGALTGRKKAAEIKLKDFYSELDEIKEMNANNEDKVQVYFESSDREYKTITKDSTPAYAIELAGGINIATDAVAIEKGSSIASYGVERILEKSDKIDVYVSQTGVMNAGGNYHSITIRPGFQAIKAIKNDRVCIINQKLISSPTFRFTKGVRELMRNFYPEIYDNVDDFNNNAVTTREALANIVVRYKHSNIYVPKSSYYRTEKSGHTYGMFQDIDIAHESYDFIETAVVAGYIEGFKDEEELEWYYPEKEVTREVFARTIYMLGDLPIQDTDVSIGDISGLASEKIIQNLVNNGVLSLENDQFNPEQIITNREVIQALNRLEEVSK